jgi:predicted alpha-1,6-mannanase (GH76 family)
MKRVSILLVTLLVAVLLRPDTATAAPPADPSQRTAATVALAATVCAVSCDTRDPSTARQDTFPVGARTQNGRKIQLHVSDADAMAWGSIDNGTVGDAIWLDRTWGDGSTWDGPIGRATIPGTWTGTRTLMYNLADPVNHKRAMIRACGDSGGIQCTDWVYSRACDAVCDGTATATAVGDSQPVPSTSLSNRQIALHFDNRGMAWATIAGGAAGDEVWLDRSWDEGVSWPDGSSRGRTSTPAGATGTRTALFAARDTRNLLYGGVLRACGRAVTGAAGSCTAWARPTGDRAAAAADALMYAYQPDTAWWISSWWNSAVAVTTLMDWMKRSGRTEHRWIVDRTFVVNRVAFPAGVRSNDAIQAHFISRSIDDAEWWAIAWIQAYDLTKDVKYLNEAVTIANYVQGYWDTKCGGGVYWDGERTYKNAVTNGLYVRMTAALHNRIPGDTTWLNRANAGWTWFNNSGMINGSLLVNDGLNSGTCANNGQTVFTYNQGLAIGAPLELWRATGNAALLTRARQLADAAMNSSTLTRGGILTESCDSLTTTCNDNGKQFKGIFMRYLMDLADVSGVASYRTYAQRQADSIWQYDRDALNRIGVRWNGQTSTAYPNVRDWRTQASGLGALLAATANPGGQPTTPPTTPPATQPPTTTPPPAGVAWSAGVSYRTGDIVTYGGGRWQCRQAHTSIAGWEPPNVASLWLAI